MDQFIIEGGHPLSGTVVPAGNKNAAQPLLAATLLTQEPVILKNVPQIGDIAIILDILRDLGADVCESGDHELTVCTRNVEKSALRADLCRKVRGSFMFAGPLLGRFGQATIPRPGGDRIGRRRVDTHLIALEGLGAQIYTNHIYGFKAPRGLTGADIFLDERSVTGTENAVMAAVLARGKTVLRNVASEPHVQELCVLLNKMGAQILGIGTNELVIEGVTEL
ncbi:MAG: UDP-N-acetylglucosamine 1-carboxyvinyltransferase, partial [Candidatus Latescibacteria bacterium]|nr:UDP-N-acetylglucosamine 1-carboxyvinyltransferase [Candidatus Latescibacterota bacterium]